MTFKNVNMTNVLISEFYRLLHKHKSLGIEMSIKYFVDEQN